MASFAQKVWTTHQQKCGAVRQELPSSYIAGEWLASPILELLMSCLPASAASSSSASDQV